MAPSRDGEPGALKMLLGLWPHHPWAVGGWWELGDRQCLQSDMFPQSWGKERSRWSTCFLFPPFYSHNMVAVLLLFASYYGENSHMPDRVLAWLGVGCWLPFYEYSLDIGHMCWEALWMVWRKMVGGPPLTLSPPYKHGLKWGSWFAWEYGLQSPT